MDHSQNATSSNLFRWKRATESKPNPAVKKQTSPDDINHWIKKVEVAADEAVSVAFGHKQPSNSRLTNAAGDETYTEARSLLNQWMVTKHIPIHSTDDGLSPSESLENLLPWADLEGPVGVPTRCQVRREWDHLMADLGVDHRGTQHQALHHLQKKDQASGDAEYIGGEEREEDEGPTVDAIVQRLMAKEYVPKAKLRAKDPGASGGARVDLKLKMDLRQEQARERREKKQTQEEQKRREGIAKREAEAEARKMLLQEERDRVADIKREEELIQKEMLKIRKEMNAQRHQEEERKIKDAADLAALDQRIHPNGSRADSGALETDYPRVDPEQIRLEEMEKRKRQITQLISYRERQNLSERLKLLQRCFANWFNLVLERRMQLGRATAIADWRQLRRHFHAWRDVARSERLDREVKVLEWQTKEEQRKQNLADNSFRRRLMRRCLFAWKIYTRHEQENRIREEFEAKKRAKMSSFLEAASKKQLVSPDSIENTDVNSSSVADSDLPPQMGLVTGVRDSKQSVDELFAAAADPQRTRHQQAAHGPIKSARSSCSGRLVSNRQRSPSLVLQQKKGAPANAGKRIIRPPTEAWQVTNAHVRLPIEQLISDQIDDENEPITSPESGRQFYLGSQSYRENSSDCHDPIAALKPPKMVNQFENRHRAQQRILADQQKQLREQQRLIEELQSTQKRQLLDRELEAQNLAQTILEKVASVGEKVKKEDAEEKGGFVEAVVLEKRPLMICQDDSESCLSPAGDGSSTRDLTTNRKSAFVKKMEARAAERARLKGEREQRRKEKEDERLGQLELELEQKRQAEEEERQRKMKNYQDKKRLEKQRELARLEYLDHLRDLTQKSDTLRNRSLMRYYGWRPWQRLMETCRRQKERAREHYETELMGRVFEGWLVHTQHTRSVEDGLVQSFQTRILIRRYFGQWKMYKNHVAMMEKRADQWNAYRQEHRVFLAWREFTIDEKLERKQRERQADIFDQRRIGLRCLRAWRRFPQLERVSREKETRKAELRRRVARLVPDYSPGNSLDTAASIITTAATDIQQPHI